MNMRIGLQNHVRILSQKLSENGYSGANFNRPAYKEMMYEVECGNVSTVIVKDQSRLGRMALQNGEAEAKKFYRQTEREKQQIETRISQVENIIRCLYEDRATGRITPERYDTMASDYEQEQEELTQELKSITDKISEMDMRDIYVKELKILKNLR